MITKDSKQASLTIKFAIATLSLMKVNRESVTLFVYIKHVACNGTCFPLCIRFLRSTGVLPVVTHTPASVLLYTSFSSMTPCPFSC